MYQCDNFLNIIPLLLNFVILHTVLSIFLLKKKNQKVVTGGIPSKLWSNHFLLLVSACIFSDYCTKYDSLPSLYSCYKSEYICRWQRDTFVYMHMLYIVKPCCKNIQHSDQNAVQKIQTFFLWLPWSSHYNIASHSHSPMQQELYTPHLTAPLFLQSCKTLTIPVLLLQPPSSLFCSLPLKEHFFRVHQWVGSCRLCLDVPGLSHWLAFR